MIEPPSRFSGLLVTGALLLFGSAVPSAPEAWQGARLIHMDRPERPATARRVQVPVMDQQPVSPLVDEDGELWVQRMDGTVEVLTPYLGRTSRWRLPAGSEAATLAGPSPDERYLLTREGRLHRLIKGRRASVTVATGLPSAYGRACRSRGVQYWPDVGGGVAAVGDGGEVHARYEGELFGRKRYRGGAAVGCADASVIVAVAGGRLVGLRDGEIDWTLEPEILRGSDFAPRVVHRGGRWILCTRDDLCLVVDPEAAEIREHALFGSLDGPVSFGEGRIGVVGTDGALHVLDSSLRERMRIPVPAESGWMVSPPTAGSTTELSTAWMVSIDGALLRADLEDGSAQAVYEMPSGASAGGTLLADGSTAAIMSDFGTLHVFQLR